MHYLNANLGEDSEFQNSFLINGSNQFRRVIRMRVELMARQLAFVLIAKEEEGG